jgi:hypothetical protein
MFLAAAQVVRNHCPGAAGIGAQVRREPRLAILDSGKAISVRERSDAANTAL